MDCRKIIAGLCLVATAASAGLWDRVEGGARVEQDKSRPATIPNIANPTVEMLNAAGWYEQRKDAAPPAGKEVVGWAWVGVDGGRSVYDPVYKDVPPVVPPEYPEPNVTVPLMLGTNVIGTARLYVDAATMGMMATTNSNSPERPYAVQVLDLKREQAAKAAVIAELNLTPAQVTAIKSYFTANVDTLFPAMTVNQRNYMKVERALVRALAKREIAETR